MQSKVGMVIVCLSVVGIGFAMSQTRADKKKEPDVKQLMQKAHKGKDSPLAIVQTQVKLDKPDWILLARNTKPLFDLANSIKDNQSYTSQPGPYVNGVKALIAAAKAKDIKKARLAADGLSKSCAGCHRSQ